MPLDSTYTANSHCNPKYSTSYAPVYQASMAAYLSGTTIVPSFTSAATATFTLATTSSCPTINCFTITTAGTPTPTLSLTSGTLPSGITFAPTGSGSAILSGTPATIASTTLQFTATNSAGSVNQTFILITVGGNTQGQGTGAGNFTFSFTPASIIGGPPLYLLSNTTLNIYQTPNTAPFSYSQPQGTVNTSNSAISPCTANCIQLATGDNFSTSWGTGFNFPIRINNVSYSVTAWNSTTVATLATAPGTQTGVAYLQPTICKPGTSNSTGNGCQGSVGYDLSGMNARGIDPYLRLTDSSVVSGHSLGATPSSGDNDEVFSCTGRTDTSLACQNASLYLFTGVFGGAVYAGGFKLVSGVPTLVAPMPTSAGAAGSHPIPGGLFSFADQDPLTGYLEAANNTCGGCTNDPQIYKEVYAWDGITGHSLTLTDTSVFDIGASCPIPNGIAFNQQSTGGFSRTTSTTISSPQT